MGANDDYRYNSASMEESISALQGFKSEADSLIEQVNAILRNKLTAEGIVGTTGEAIIEAYDEDVLKPAISYSEAAETNITRNQTVQELHNENSQKNVNIARG